MRAAPLALLVLLLSPAAAPAAQAALPAPALPPGPNCHHDLPPPGPPLPAPQHSHVPLSTYLLGYVFTVVAFGLSYARSCMHLPF